MKFHMDQTLRLWVNCSSEEREYKKPGGGCGGKQLLRN